MSPQAQEDRASRPGPLPTFHSTMNSLSAWKLGWVKEHPLVKGCQGWKADLNLVFEPDCRGLLCVHPPLQHGLGFLDRAVSQIVQFKDGPARWTDSVSTSAVSSPAPSSAVQHGFPPLPSISSPFIPPTLLSSPALPPVFPPSPPLSTALLSSSHTPPLSFLLLSLLCPLPIPLILVLCPV